MVTLTPYSNYISKSRYARFLPELQRRENWNETVARYFDFMTSHLKSKCNYELKPELRAQLEDAVLTMKVMPSMRLLMTAGKPVSRCNVSAFNCAYLPVDSPVAFDEAMYVLMCGTGVGFSVERPYIQKLPEIPEQLFESKTTIVVADSRAGWAKALRQLIALLYTGEIPKWDVSKVRPAGAPLKTFGGRASGPGPLQDLFQFVVAKFKAAAGRKLTSLECHDIMCKIGQVVVVGGVRRSAMISLSDLSDERMRDAKSGNWDEHNSQRRLANNSAVYDGRPEMGVFMQEWLSLYKSKSGERGLFNRKASQQQAGMNGRRDTNHIFGTNPCSEIILRPYQFCNLTEVVVRADDTYETLLDKARLAAILGTFQATLTDFQYLRKIWKKNTEEEALLGVSLTGIYDNPLTYDVSDPELAWRLENMREMVVKTNKAFAKELGINPSAAATCVKPSGTVSQLVDSASGAHPRHAHFYIRRVRGDAKDPLTAFMIRSGIPWEQCVYGNDIVFSFPMKSNKKSVTKDQVSAISQLELWLALQNHWCEHKPSMTVSVKESEWMEVGAFVWKHFDQFTGVTFLPADESTVAYKQLPYETITEEEYNQLLEKMPKEIDWDSFQEFDDNVEGVQTLACTGGYCEI